MKRSLILLLLLSLVLTGCGSESTDADDQQVEIGPNEMLDTETGIIYALGDSREVFDGAFDDPSSDTDTFAFGEDGDEEVSYFVKDGFGELSITYKDSRAVAIHCNGGNRFKFSDFDYSMALEDVKGTFSLDRSSIAELDTYAQYYDVDGNTVEKSNSAFEHFVLVCNSDYGPYKSGDYVGFTLALPYDQISGNN